MCYGSGCRKEDYMGECCVYDFEFFRKTEFHSPCVVFGNYDEVVKFYLTKEEFKEWTETYNGELEQLALQRWREDKDRIKIIEEYENESKDKWKFN